MKNKVITRAHGRVNLIGEHTDYNGGWVLPTTIPQFTEVELTVGKTNEVVIESSMDKEGHQRLHRFKVGEEEFTGTWADYLVGGTKLLREALSTKEIRGFHASIRSNIPEGSGLSSSAALEISFLKGMKELFEINIEDIELAKIGQRIENEFVGAKVGIMDQMASCFARENEALFLDTQELQFERIPLPLDLMEIMVINSGIAHHLAAGEGGYNERRAQCEEAARLLGVPALREADMTLLNLSNIPEILFRRARHVITENERVKRAAQALKKRDPESLGKLFNESHESMRVDYEVSIPEIDLLVNLCLNEKDVFGARLTGGGFGGSIVAIVIKGMKEEISKKVIEKYKYETGLKAIWLL
jgi:galactokinase